MDKLTICIDRYQHDRDIVRHLAARLAELAARPENSTVIQRWRDVNALRRPDRPPVWCRPVGAWEELLPAADLQCRDEWHRAVERTLRQALIKAYIGDDTPLYPTYQVPARFRVTPANIWGLDIKRQRPAEKDGAWKYIPALATAADYDRLQLPTFTYDRLATQAALDKAADLFAGILQVELSCHPPLSSILGNLAAELCGLEEMMVNMMVAPDLVHRLMAHLRDGVLKAMAEVAATGLLTLNNAEAMTCSDAFGPSGSPYTYRNLWVMSNSQEFDQVSPAMWEEFCLQYQMPIITQFGMSAYGCCENLTHKWRGVLTIPNLRIFVCSAWTHLSTIVEQVGSDYVIMWRQKASDVVFAADPETLRAQLREGLERLRGCHVQIVLRELQTLAGHMDRLHVWTRLAIEEAEKIAI